MIKGTSLISVNIRLIILSLVFILFFNNCNPTKEQVEIGALLPLSGPGANYGKWEKQGIDLAVEEINGAGGIDGKDLVIVYEDIMSDPQKAVSAYNKLISVNKISSSVAGISSVVLALAPIADNNKTVLMNCGGISPRIPEVTGNYVFSNIVDGSLEVTKMAEYIHDSLKINRVSLFTINSAAGIDAKNTFQKVFEKLGGEILSTEFHDPGASDFKSQILKLKSTKPEAVYLTSFTKESAIILKQAKELDFNTRWFSYAPFEGDEILNIAGSAAEGVIYTSQAFDPHSNDPRVKSYQEKYYKKYGEYSEIYAATFYDGIYMISEAMKNSGLTGTEIRDGLRRLQDFSGVTGKIKFDSRQVAVKPIIFKIVKNGSFQILE